MQWRIILPRKDSAAMNMAIDEVIFQEVQQGSNPTIRFYQWKPGAVSLGYGQHVSIINKQNCQASGIEYVRRMTGGNAVYHDAHDYTYMVAAPLTCFGNPNIQEGVSRNAYESICGWIIAALQNIGIPAVFYGKNDIVVNQKKIVGNAQRLSDDQKTILQHGSLFYNARPEQWIAYLHVDQERLRNITNIQQLKPGIKEPLFHDALFNAFVDNPMVNQRFTISDLSDEELRKATQLAQEKYGNQHVEGTGTEREGDICIVDITND